MSTSEIDKRWLENTLHERGHPNLLSEIPETGRYTLEEQDESIIIKDSENKQPPLTYEDIESLVHDLESYEEGRCGDFELDEGDVLIYSRENSDQWVQSDTYVDLEEIS